jgi:aspartyl aminopeptidase
MELAFRTKSLRSLCGDEAVAVQQLGGNLATELRARIADLRAGTSFDDIIAGQPEFLNDHDPRAIIALGEGITIVIRPNHPDTSGNVQPRFDWKHVYRIRIDEVTMPKPGEAR